MKQMDALTTVHVDLHKNRSIHAVLDNNPPRRENRTCFSCMTITTDTSKCFAVGVRIPQHRDGLEVSFPQPCGQAFIVYSLLQLIVLVDSLYAVLLIRRSGLCIACIGACLMRTHFCILHIGWAFGMLSSLHWCQAKNTSGYSTRTTYFFLIFESGTGAFTLYRSQLYTNGQCRVSQCRFQWTFVKSQLLLYWHGSSGVPK